MRVLVWGRRENTHKILGRYAQPTTRERAQAPPEVRMKPHADDSVNYHSRGCLCICTKPDLSFPGQTVNRCQQVRPRKASNMGEGHDEQGSHFPQLPSLLPDGGLAGMYLRVTHGDPTNNSHLEISISLSHTVESVLSARTFTYSLSNRLPSSPPRKLRLQLKQRYPRGH